MTRRDFLAPDARSALMSSIRSKNTKAELALGRLLRRHRIRFRRYVKGLPGTPDFVLLGLKIAVFVDGGFWHGRNFDRLRPNLKPYWVDKIERNMNRDVSSRSRLRCMGWSVLKIWEEDVLTRPEKCHRRILRAMKGRSTRQATLPPSIHPPPNRSKVRG